MMNHSALIPLSCGTFTMKGNYRPMAPLATAPNMFRIALDSTDVSQFQEKARALLTSVVQESFARYIARELLVLWDSSRDSALFSQCVAKLHQKYCFPASGLPVKGMILYYEMFYSVLKDIQNEPVRSPLALDLYAPTQPDGYLYGRIASSANKVISHDSLLDSLTDSGLAERVETTVPLNDFPAYARIPVSSNASLRIKSARVQDAISSVSTGERLAALESVTGNKQNISISPFSWGKFVSLKANISTTKELAAA